MKYYGMSRRWQYDYSEKEYKSNFRNKSLLKSAIKRVWKNFPLFPPISLINTLLLFKNRETFSFQPSIPLREKQIVALENYDSLFDYNSLKRLIFGPLINILLFFSKGRFYFYSEKSKISLPRNIFTHDILSRSKVEEFFIIKDKYILKTKLNSEKENIIMFAGDFYLKGGMELILSLQEINKKYRVCLFVPENQINYVKKFIKEYHDNKYIIIEIKKFNENDPSEYYEILKKAKIFALPTFYDSHAIVIKEAKQMNCITIATDVFDAASGVNYKLKPYFQFFSNYRLKIPFSGDMIIGYYSNKHRKICFYIIKQLKEIFTQIL